MDCGSKNNLEEVTLTDEWKDVLKNMHINSNNIFFKCLRIITGIIKEF